MLPNRNKTKTEINAASVIPMTIFPLKFNGYINYKLSYLSVLCPCKNMTFKGELFLNKLRILRAKTTYTWYIHLFPNMQPLIQTAAATFRLDSLPPKEWVSHEYRQLSKFPQPNGICFSEGWNQYENTGHEYICWNSVLPWLTDVFSYPQRSA